MMTHFHYGRTKDLDEVLQVRSVFTNVSKGATAKASELEECFKTTDTDKIILEVWCSSLCTSRIPCVDSDEG